MIEEIQRDLLGFASMVFLLLGFVLGAKALTKMKRTSAEVMNVALFVLLLSIAAWQRM